MNASATLRIGTRGSALARWQADHVAGLLLQMAGAPPVETVVIKTEGDIITDVPLSRVAGKAFFTKEIEQALLEGRIDLAVHSLKDLATVQPDGLCVGAVLEREDPRDALVSAGGTDFETLPSGARVGTSSLRRRALLARWRPDVELLDLRGNVPTRLEQVSDGTFDAVVLAVAGLKRLGLHERISQFLPPERILPAVSQGAVAVQIREDDDATLGWVARLDHAPTRSATDAERALLRTLEGGCQVPVGALATAEEGRLAMTAVVCSLDGADSFEGTASGSTSDAERIGTDLAGTLLDRGAGRILDAIRADQGPA
jgi:hydroxymethylbilane synthase